MELALLTASLAFLWLSRMLAASEVACLGSVVLAAALLVLLLFLTSLTSLVAEAILFEVASTSALALSAGVCCASVVAAASLLAAIGAAFKVK